MENNNRIKNNIIILMNFDVLNVIYTFNFNNTVFLTFVVFITFFFVNKT